MQNEINIAFSINKKFLKYCRVLISSILASSKSPVVFHILSKELDENDENFLRKTLATHEFKINFYNPEIEIKDFIIRKNDYLGVETYFRFFLPDLLKDVHTVLYMDVDIICLDDLTPLFKIDISNFPCAMCPDLTFSDVKNFNRLEYPMEKGYYNAGVMLINLDYWRENSVAEKLISYVKKNPKRCLKHDQDAINKVLNGKIFELSTRYNFQHRFFNICGVMEKYSSCERDFSKLQEPLIVSTKWHEIAESMEHLVLVHFCAQQKPWHKECNMPFSKTWRAFCKKEFGKIKLNSCYSFSKQIKIYIHNILAKLKFMQKIKCEVYDYRGYDIEKQNFLNV